MMKMELLFLNMSAGEIFIILLFILMFFGSKSIPTIARTLGRTIRQVKDATDEIKHDIRKSASDVTGDFDLKSQVEKTLFSDDKKESKKDEYLREQESEKSKGESEKSKKESESEKENKSPDNKQNLESNSQTIPYNPKNPQPSKNQGNQGENQGNQGQNQANQDL